MSTTLTGRLLHHVIYVVGVLPENGEVGHVKRGWRLLTHLDRQHLETKTGLPVNVKGGA